METTTRRYGNALILPPRGEVLFATDLHGNIDDFRRIVEVYQERRAARDATFLLLGGDFVHGPSYSAEEWPDYLGDFALDNTPALFRELEALLEEDPQVLVLLGNHEHAHIGGPRTSKFHQDPDEVDYLESALGAEVTHRFKAFLRELPLVAFAPCGVLFMHAAPAVQSGGFEEVARVPLEGYGHLRIDQIYEVPIIGELLWAKWSEPARAAAFLRRMSFDGIEPRVAVYGHDIIQEGYERTPPNQLIVSTSFGMQRANKTLCVVDLGRRYESVDDFREGMELVALYPKAERVRAEIPSQSRSHEAN